MGGALAEFHRDLYDWIGALVRARPREQRPVVVGLSAPQGAGKTTLAATLARQAAADGLRLVAISIDDFYLTRAEQAALTAAHPDNPYLQSRGYPGTHDVGLGAATLRGLKQLGAGETFAVPSYDRLAFGGKGDRRPEADWPVIAGPLDVVLLEGWMLGFSPLATPPGDPGLAYSNAELQSYAVWTGALDALIWLKPLDHRYVIEWRAEAEDKARAAGLGGMTPDETRAFVTRFMPAYDTWLPTLASRPPIAGPMLMVTIGRDRLPVRA